MWFPYTDFLKSWTGLYGFAKPAKPDDNLDITTPNAKASDPKETSPAEKAKAKAEPVSYDKVDDHPVKDSSFVGSDVFGLAQKLIFFGACVGVVLVWYRMRSKASSDVKYHPV